MANTVAQQRQDAVDLAVTPETVLPLSWSSLPPTPSDIANVGRDDLAIADCADLSVRVVDRRTRVGTILQQGAGLVCPVGVDGGSDGTVYAADAGEIVQTGAGCPGPPCTTTVTRGKVIAYPPAGGTPVTVFEDLTDNVVFLTDVVVESATHLLVTSKLDEVNAHLPGLHRIDIAAGTSTQVLGFGLFDVPTSVDVDGTGDIFVSVLEVDPFTEEVVEARILRVDPVTGTPTTESIGSPLDGPVGITVASDDLLIADPGATPALRFLDLPALAAPTLLSDDVQLIAPTGIAVPEPDARIALFLGLAGVAFAARLRASGAPG